MNTHKIATMLALCCTLATAAMSQVRSQFLEEIAVGVHGGLNLAQVRMLHNDLSYNNQIGDLGYRPGAVIGITARFIAQKHFGLQLEADYLQGGYKEKFDSEASVNNVNFAGAESERETDYLSIPLLAHIYFGNTNRFIINLGPKIAFKTGSDTKKSFNAEQTAVIAKDNGNDPRINNKIEEKKTDYGLCLGAGYECHLNKVDITAEFRWTYGLQDVYPHSKTDVFQRSNNQMFQFTLGVMMPVVKFHSN